MNEGKGGDRIAQRSATGAAAAQDARKRKAVAGAGIALCIALGGAALLLAPAGNAAEAAPVLEKLDGFTHGPQLGNVTSHSVRVWARTRQPASFSVRYSTEPDLGNAKTSPAIQTSWDHDATGWVDLTGLESNTKYYYALVLDGRVADTRVNGKINSFLTLPDSADFVNRELNPKGLFNFAFEVGTGNSQRNKARPPTYTTMLNNLKERIHFQIQNGDWIYEAGRDKTEAQWAADNKVGTLPDIASFGQGVAGVWENYKLYLDGSRPLAEFYREVPQFVTLDDHEILNDATGSGHTGFRFDSRGKGWQTDQAWRNPQAPDKGGLAADVERAVFRDPALAAWDDYVGWSNPDIGRHRRTHFGQAHLTKGSDVLTDPKADFTKLDLKKVSNLHVLWGYGNTGVYEIVKVLGPNQIKVKPALAVTEDARYSIGTNHYSRFRVANAEFFLLDTRSYRTLHDKNKLNDPKASMLGRVQEKWLLDGLKNSDADFFFIVSSVNLAVPHDNGAWYGRGMDSAGKDDGWTAQLHAREKLIKVAESLGKPVIFLTGDLHKSFVARVAPGVYDIGTGPHTSGNHRLGDAGGSPPSGWYNSGGRLVDLVWTSNQYRNDSGGNPRATVGKGWPIYTVIRVNNTYNVPDKDGRDRWIAYPEPQVVIEFHDGYTGDLSFAYSLSTTDAKRKPVAVPLERVKVLGGIAEPAKNASR
ncbi:MAG: alkaline phosphatase D family protein [Deltaproteobacteria bacterium]|nr:alkaline phosphatase D family protein [Deltaproteobacteria bacterium]